MNSNINRIVKKAVWENWTRNSLSHMKHAVYRCYLGTVKFNESCKSEKRILINKRYNLLCYHQWSVTYGTANAKVRLRNAHILDK